MGDDVEQISTRPRPGVEQQAVQQSMGAIEAQPVVRRRAEALTALQAAVLDITVRRDLQSLVQTIVERATELLHATGGALFLAELPEGEATSPGPHSMRCAASYNMGPSYRDLVLPPGSGVAGRVARTGEPLMVDEYATWPAKMPDSEDVPCGPVLAVPMVYQEELTGVVGVFRRRGDPVFDLEDSNLFRLLADHAAIVVENTRLYDRVQAELAQCRRLEQLGAERAVYLERLIACTPDAVVTVDAAQRIREWNPGAIRLFGYTREQAIGTDLDSMIAGHDPERYREACDWTRRTLAGETISAIETIRYRRDGTPVTVLLSASPIVVDGQPAGTVTVYTDLTEHKTARQALAESEERYRTLVENLPIGVYRTTPGDQGRILMANPAYLRMQGYESESGLAKVAVSDLYVNPAERRIFSDLVIEQGSVSGVELQLKQPDGTILWGSVTAQAVRDETTGEVAWFDCTMEDVTRRKRALEIQGLVYRIGSAAQLARDEQTLFDAIRRELGTFLDTRNLFVAVYDPERDEISLPYIVDDYDSAAYDAESHTFPAGKTLTSYVIRNNRSLLAREEDLRALEEAGEVELVGTPSKVWLGVPLQAAGDPTLYSDRPVAGALVVQSYTDPAAYGPEEQAMLEFVSGQISLSIERVHAERELRRLKEFNEGIVQNMAEGIAVQDADGVFTFVNRAGAEMLGYDASPSAENSLVGEHWTRVVPEDQHPIMVAADQRRLAGETDRYQVDLMHRDGSRFPALVSRSSRFNDQGQFEGTLAVLLNIGERVAAEEKLARYAREMAALYETSLEINAQRDLPALLSAIVRRATRLVDLPIGALYLLRPDGQVLDLVVAQNLPPKPGGTSLQLGEGLSGRVAQTGEPLMVVDYQQWDGRARAYERDPLGRVLGVPMKVGDRVIGVIDVIDDAHGTQVPPGQPPFTEDEVWLTTLFADQAAIAVENASLFEAEREQRELAEALRQATAAVSSSLDLDQILDQILEQVDRVIPGDAANIALIEGDWAQIVRCRGYERFGFDIQAVMLPLADTPTLGQMQQTGKPMIIVDTSAFDGWVSVPGGRWIRSYVGAPIQARDHLIGFLNVDSVTPGFFSQTHADRLEAFADQASVALANAQLFGIVEQAKRDWEATFDAMPDPVVVVDLGGCVVRANLAFARLVDRPVRQVVGEKYNALLDAATGDEGAGGSEGPGLQPAEMSGPIATHIQQCKGRIFEVQATPVHSKPAGDLDRTNRVIYAMRDITERKRAEREIERRNRDLAFLNRIVAAAAARRPVAVTLETICHELAHAFDAPRVVAWLLNSDRTEAVVVAAHTGEGAAGGSTKKTRFEGEDSARRVFETCSVLVLVGGGVDTCPLPEPDEGSPELVVRRLLCWPEPASGLWLPLVVEGQSAGYLEVMAQERREFEANEIELAQRVAEQASAALVRARLEEAERRLSAAVEQAAEAVVITDTENMILYANPAFEQITGLKRREVVGTKSTRFQTINDSPSYRALWQAVQTNQDWQGRVADVRPDGVPFVIDITLTPVRVTPDEGGGAPAEGLEMGKIVNRVVTMRNVTREVQLEEQFQQAQKLEALGRLAGGIAHDFNNLLTVIHLSTRLLERQLRPEDPLWEHVQHIRQTGERAAKLTKQLLSFSRREVIDPQVVSVNRIVGDLERMLQRIIGEDVQLVTDLQPDLWAVQADPVQIEQVVMNLAVNARDAMPQGGTLTIETRNVTLSPAYVAFHVDAEPGEHVLLSVVDTGEGMDAAVKAHLFEPFFTTKPREQGTGLGLSTVFGIVKQSKGHIRVESEPGEGTSIHIYLPRCLESGLPAATPAHPLDTQRGTGQHRVVLVVEDDAAVRMLATHVLQSYGWQVIPANNGVDALRASHEYEGRIDLLVTDVVMPLMDGKKLAEQLHVVRPEMAVLYMSGYADNVLLKSDTLPSDSAFLSKPFTVEDLIRKVQGVMDAQAMPREDQG